MRLALLLAAVAWGAHQAEPKLQTVSDAVERQNTLAEMWQRRIIGADATRWSAEEQVLLERMRRAEKGGAVGFLRKRGGLKGWVFESKPSGVPRLTKEGHERYVFLKSQEAVRYFESREVPAKSIFLLRDQAQQPLFEGEGTLTEAGEALFDLAASGQPAFWLTPEGLLQGNRRRPPTK
jgi:hypothetical protein